MFPASSAGAAAIARVILSCETVTAITPVSSRLSAAMISAPFADFSIRMRVRGPGPALLDPAVGVAHRLLGCLEVGVAAVAVEQVAVGAVDPPDLADDVVARCLVLEGGVPARDDLGEAPAASRPCRVQELGVEEPPPAAFQELAFGGGGALLELAGGAERAHRLLDPSERGSGMCSGQSSSPSLRAGVVGPDGTGARARSGRGDRGGCSRRARAGARRGRARGSVA